LFSKEVEQAIVASFLSGEYNLLLGAGVSLDSTNGNGDLLPGAEQLRIDLCTLKGARKNSSLQRVFGTLTDAEKTQHVVGKFNKCQPGASVTKITNFLWRRIFTFNIDDALEAAYGKIEEDCQTVHPLHFADDYWETREQDKLPIVHLHGWVRQPDKGFVFSISEYVRQIKDMNPWMHVLTQFLPSEPFIIAGTSLEEVDLEYYIAHRSNLTSRDDRGPSILIEPAPDSVTEHDCAKYDLLLFKGTVIEFFEYLEKLVPYKPKPIDLMPAATRDLFPGGISARTILAFSADFDLINCDVDGDDGVSKFLYGHEIEWGDLYVEKDIPRKLTRSIMNKIQDRFDNVNLPSRLVLLSDGTGSGKTTVLRRVAYNFAKQGCKVLLCSALSRLDVLTTSEAIDLIDEPLLIVVDNLADQANPISQIISNLEKRDVVFLAAERKYRSRYTDNSFQGNLYEKVGGLSLSELEAGRLIGLYSKHGLSAGEDAHNNPANLAAKISKDAIAVACCRILNDFKPLERIVGSIVEDASSNELFAYLVASISQHCFHAGIRQEVLTKLLGQRVSDDQFSETHVLPLTYFEGNWRNYIIPLNASISDRIIQYARDNFKEKLLQVFVAIANELAPRVNRWAIQQRTPEARLIGRLCDYDQVTFVYLGEYAEKFYDEIRDKWAWNSRYWEQLALMHLGWYYEAPSSNEGLDALKQALQHARHAVSIENHPLPLTTLCNILLVHIGLKGVGLRDIYDEAHERLTYAIKRQAGWYGNVSHPYIVLFKGARAYIDAGGELTHSQHEDIDSLIIEAQKRCRYNNEVDMAISSLNDAIKNK